MVEHLPDGQGITAILMANVLGCFDLSVYDPLDPYRAHLELDAVKLAYVACNRLAAEAECSAPPLAALRDAVQKGAAYLSVVDKDLMAVSLLYSNVHGFGAGLAASEFGVLFHNRGSAFSLQPGHPNELSRNKCPMQMRLPAMLRQGGRLDTVFGSVGGRDQPTGHIRMRTNWIDFGMGLQEALGAPRSVSMKTVLSLRNAGIRGLSRQNFGCLAM